MEFQYEEHGGNKNAQYYRPNNSYIPPTGRFNNYAYYNYSPSDVPNHWCETCDRGFKTAFLLDKHIKEHMTCSIDGCKFVAHPKVITKHIEMQHSTGLYNKIGNLSNPEAIAKWREERKKRYPTKQNIEKKMAELKEKFERGEKMGLKQFSKGVQDKDTNSKMKKDLHKQKFKRKPRHNKTCLTGTLSKETNKVVECDERRLKPFGGIQSITLSESEDDSYVKPDETINIEDDDVEIKIAACNQNVTNSTVCSALSSLIMNYDSSEEETSTNNDKPSIKANLNTDQMITSTLIKNNVNVDQLVDDDRPEEVKINKVVADLLPNEESRNRSQTVMKIKNKVMPRHQRVYKRPKVPSTLLEKLLNQEIRHERNVALQCIRYIIKNNYFSEKELAR